MILSRQLTKNVISSRFLDYVKMHNVDNLLIIVQFIANFIKKTFAVKKNKVYLKST